MEIINKNKWERKEHFDFFSEFDEPYFGITSEIDCSVSFHHCKKYKISFFAYYLHKSLLAANRIKELKYRIKQNDVVYFEKIGASPTIGRENGTFAFSFIDYNEDFNIFYNSLQEEIEAVNSSTGLRAAGDTDKIDVIHYSSIPWIRFSGITHARRFNSNDSCPKITFGKMSANENSYTMPIAVNAHHGLADGKHVGEFLSLFQDILNR